MLFYPPSPTLRRHQKQKYCRNKPAIYIARQMRHSDEAEMLKSPFCLTLIKYCCAYGTPLTQGALRAGRPRFSPEELKVSDGTFVGLCQPHTWTARRGRGRCLEQTISYVSSSSLGPVRHPRSKRIGGSQCHPQAAWQKPKAEENLGPTNK